SGFTRLETVAISQASADQRAGRAGRVAAGVAYRLWPQSRRLERSRGAEIAQAELSGLALELAAWGVTAADGGDLAWLDPPPPGALAQARELLQALDALDRDACITALGRRMLELGASPRLAAAAARRAARSTPARWPRSSRPARAGADVWTSEPRPPAYPTATPWATCWRTPSPTASPIAMATIRAATCWPTAAAPACTNTRRCSANPGWW